MVKVNWTPENDRKLLLQLITPASKDIPIDYIATLFPGATTKSITERIAKLRREKKAATSAGTTPTTTPTKKGSTKAAKTNPSPLSAKNVSDPAWVGGSQDSHSKSTDYPFISHVKGRKREGEELDSVEGSKKVKVEASDDVDEVDNENDGEESPEVKGEDLDDRYAL